VIGALTLFFLAAGANGTTPVAAATSPALAVEPGLPLAHRGKWIVDASGRVVILHGFNMVDKRTPYEPAAAGFDDQDAAFLEHEGFNAVRVGVLFEAVEPEPGRFSTSYLRSIARTVAVLGRHGIVSLLDFHQDAYSERFDGEGFPSWAVDDGGLPLLPQGNNWAVNEQSMPAVWKAYSEFWADAAGPGGVGLQQRYAAAWRFVARWFRSDGDVLGYELMNEPFPGTGYQSCLGLGCPGFDAQLTTFYRRVDRSIRSVDHHTLVFVEPSVLFDFDLPTHLGAVDPDAAFSFHPYCQGSPLSCGSGVARDFAAAEHYGAQNHNALLVTEFGGSLDPRALAPVLSDADADDVGWLEWSFWNRDPVPSGPDSTTLIVNLHRPPTGANVRWSLLRTLARPYPAVIAGTPGPFDYDAATGAFHLSWSTARASGRGRFGADAATVIEVPPLAYPHGYGAHVAGGRILSKPGAQHLVVEACPGVVTLSVTLGPSGRDRSTC
jgi:endoglycosylceramidase